MEKGKTNTFSMISKENFTIGKLIFLCIMCLALSVFGPLALFAPLPMAFAFLMYGNAKTLAVSGTLVALTLLGASANDLLAQISGSAYLMIYSIIMGFTCSTIIVKNEDPVRGLIKRGFIFIFVIFALLGFAEVISPNVLTSAIDSTVTNALEVFKNSENYKAIKDQSSEVAITYQQLLNNPQEIIDQIYKWGFSFIFVSTFFILWLTVFMLLRNAKMWQLLHGYRFGLKNFVQFKAPEFFAYIVVAGLALYLLSDTLGSEVYGLIGINILLCLGVFYFFQGMGVYLDFLKHVKLKGFIRSILTIMTIFFAYRMITILGLLDNWVDFRRFFKKNEGDIK